MESKKVKFMEPESRMVGSERNGEILVKRYKISVIRYLNTGDVMYHIVNIIITAECYM